MTTPTPSDQPERRVRTSGRLRRLVAGLVDRLGLEEVERCAEVRCGGVLLDGDLVRVVPVFSAHDPRNWGPGPPQAEPVRTDRYHPACADALGLVVARPGAADRRIWLGVV